MGTRWLAPGLGRWVSADPLFLEKPEDALNAILEVNGYSYALGNPTKYKDPSGLRSKTNRTTTYYTSKNEIPEFERNHGFYESTGTLIGYRTVGSFAADNGLKDPLRILRYPNNWRGSVGKFLSPSPKAKSGWLGVLLNGLTVWDAYDSWRTPTPEETLQVLRELDEQKTMIERSMEEAKRELRVVSGKLDEQKRSFDYFKSIGATGDDRFEEIGDVRTYIPHISTAISRQFHRGR
jgi:hypothetical protein